MAHYSIMKGEGGSSGSICGRRNQSGGESIDHVPPAAPDRWQYLRVAGRTLVR